MASGQDFALATMARPMSYESLNMASGSQHEQDSTHYEQEAPQYEEAVPIRGEALPPYQRQDINDTTPLRPNHYILVPTALYTALVVYTWVVICMIARGPVVMDNGRLRYREYYAARITQSIVSVATLPVISAVCACAAAVFVQNQRETDSLSLRQVMALADHKWTDPFSLIRTPSSPKKWGTRFLYLALFTHVIGAITYPIQSVFLHVEERFSNYHGTTSSLVQGAGGPEDSIMTFARMASNEVQPFKSEAIVSLRNQLQCADAGGFQAQLWGNATRLTKYNPDVDWYAQVPATYNTGSLRQITPRINSTAKSSRVGLGEFPTNCSSVQDYFYTSLNYSSQYLGMMNIQACLPSNVTLSPWLATDARQDFTEELYLSINTSGLGADFASSVNGAYKITMNTTAAFFELPNAFNGGKPGDLLPNPNISCGYNYGCIDLKDTTIAAALEQKRYVDDDSLAYQLAESNNLLGPLATITVALFGPGSWFDNQQALFSSDYDGYENETGWREYLDQSLQNSLIPLYSLIDGHDSTTTEMDSTSPVYEWLTVFIDQGADSTLGDTFARASYFANKALIETTQSLMGYSVVTGTVNSELMPSISLAGVIVVSILIGLYMIPLLALALYAGFSDCWTHTLDSFVMLRMGAAIGQKDLPLQIGRRTDKIGVLDQLPGVVRDISGPDDKVRQLALGRGGSRLQSKVRYLAYPGNHRTSA